MTEGQILEQLERLSTLGNIEIERIPEYVRSLKNFMFSDLQQAITELIDTWMERRFPRPADIRNQLSKIIVRRQQYNPDRSGNQRNTTVFLDTLNALWKLGNREDYFRLHKKMMDVNGKYDDNIKHNDDYEAEMRAIQDEAKRLPQRIDRAI